MSAPLWDTTPPPIRLTIKPTVGDRVFTFVVRFGWAYRVEAAAVAVLPLTWAVLAAGLGARTGLVVVTAVAAALGVVPSWRRGVIRVLRSAWVRRCWVRACRHAELATLNDRVPRAVKVTAVPCGDLLDVRVPKGSSVTRLEDAAETVAACLGVREVRVTRDAGNARRARVLMVRRDPLETDRPLSWPNAEADTLSLWEPVPVGVDEDGQLVTVSLPERNVLLGGEPGAGKSAALSMLVASAALDPSVRLWLLDGKLVELACWTGCAQRSVGVDVADAIGVLRQLQTEMDARYRRLLADGRRKVGPDDDLALHVVVCDELAHYLSAPDRKQRGEFAVVMRDLVSRGRAAGIIVLAATQKPSGDVIPTALRDLFGFRWALRCSTPQASDTILGQGWASQGFNAASIDAAQRGVGYLLHEGGRPVRLRAHYLDDDQLMRIAARAAALRGRTDREHRPRLYEVGA
ncbi:MAG: FtsK/SpoIIIE domain-containing protein [Actinomycetota bacterium]|nr:FtsK/SpoIIIE domain-containing protein [Actinomycetota bacterium]